MQYVLFLFSAFVAAPGGALAGHHAGAPVERRVPSPAVEDIAQRPAPAGAPVEWQVPSPANEDIAQHPAPAGAPVEWQAPPPAIEDIAQHPAPAAVPVEREAPPPAIEDIAQHPAPADAPVEWQVPSPANEDIAQRPAPAGAPVEWQVPSPANEDIAQHPAAAPLPATPPSRTVASIPLPPGFTRVSQPPGTFGAWLRAVPLKEDNTVYLFNGRKKQDQQAQFAVLDVSVGSKDLQQCADAVMRLYAEYLYEHKQFSKIAFRATDGTLMDYDGWRSGIRYGLRQGRLVKRRTAAPAENRQVFLQYLEAVFAWAGTLSLSRELKPATAVMPGHVFIQGGAPGHAVIVVDVAANGAGERRYLLAQSYMPAQSIHILNNPANAGSPWYSTPVAQTLVTPEWSFRPGSLKQF
ncbi:DUF4846 domain-containing protein [Chitinophaga alhagiae]|uniref:DUF4846 domain-containing protein n=1 Tax=Chitinophaga alhagiae TaxID=2203219 RepID=UPI000E5B447C|nr:DUF4846 domain-containing protein [Chitinophaga alhagiae]